MYKELFSNERLSRYKKLPTDTDYNVINSYLWNIELSAAFYPPLALLEVVLRNRIHNAISSSLKENWLEEDNPWFNSRTKKKIKTIKDNNKTITIGKLISELTLGFWVYLFNNEFKTIIWDKKGIFDSVFPNFDIKTTNRLSVIAPKLRDIGKLRNRISHHEPILDDPKGLNNKHEDILLILKWLSNDAYELSKTIDSFNSIWERKEHNYINAKALIETQAYYNHINNPDNSPEANWLIAEKELMNV